jgi:hypothetical protein
MDCPRSAESRRAAGRPLGARCCGYGPRLLVRLRRCSPTGRTGTRRTQRAPATASSLPDAPQEWCTRREPAWGSRTPFCRAATHTPHHPTERTRHHEPPGSRQPLLSEGSSQRSRLSRTKPDHGLPDPAARPRATIAYALRAYVCPGHGLPPAITGGFVPSSGCRPSLMSAAATRHICVQVRRYQ